MKAIIIFIVILGIALLGYFYFVPSTSEVTLEEEPEVKQQVAPTGIPANWKTFTSSEFGVSFRHPPAWQIEEVEPGIYVVLTKTGEAIENAPMSIDVRGDLPYERAVQEIRSNIVTPSEKSLRVGSVPGVELSGYLKEDAAEVRTFSIFSMLNNAGRLLSLDYGERDEASEEMRRMYRLMVSSVTFSRDAI